MVSSCPACPPLEMRARGPQRQSECLDGEFQKHRCMSADSGRTVAFGCCSEDPAYQIKHCNTAASFMFVMGWYRLSYACTYIIGSPLFSFLRGFDYSPRSPMGWVSTTNPKI